MRWFDNHDTPPDFDEINDVFYVLGNGISTKDFHLYIFDRWGSVIYE
ncbi:MAG: hypothetical protein HGA85_08935, partial [Nanoarchaeota archaeon]|nr:hypothetical protein [Nanoarchaeota archaeon]